MANKVIVNIGIYDFALLAEDGNIYIKQADYTSDKDEAVVMLDIEQVDFFIKLLKRVKHEYEIKLEKSENQGEQ